MENAIKKRDYGFDNIKLFLIILVVLGHTMEEINLTGILGIIRSIIYSFHMPLFIFISGYFSRLSNNKTLRAFKEYLMPFLIFNTVYAMLTSQTYMVNIFLPLYAFWYLLSLFFWSISIEYIVKFKPLLLVSFMFGIYCGFFNSIDRLFSLSRTICFFPFFILGYLFDSKKINRLRSINIALPLTGIIFSIFITAFLNYKDIIPVKMYEMLQSYIKTGVGNIEGAIQRTIIYLVAIILVFSFIALIPNKEYRFTEFGKRTACIYIVSSFLIKILFAKILGKFDISLFLDNAFTEFVASIIIMIAVLILSGNKYIFKAYNAFIGFIDKIAIRP